MPDYFLGIAEEAANIDVFVGLTQNVVPYVDVHVNVATGKDFLMGVKITGRNDNPYTTLYWDCTPPPPLPIIPILPDRNWVYLASGYWNCYNGCNQWVGVVRVTPASPTACTFRLLVWDYNGGPLVAEKYYKVRFVYSPIPASVVVPGVSLGTAPSPGIGLPCIPGVNCPIPPLCIPGINCPIPSFPSVQGIIPTQLPNIPDINNILPGTGLIKICEDGWGCLYSIPCIAPACDPNTVILCDNQTLCHPDCTPCGNVPSLLYCTECV